MVRTVGLIGSNGNVGKDVLKNLLKYADEGKIKIVVFHRPESHVEKSSHIEARTLDIEQDSEEELVPKLKGLDVLITTIAMGAPQAGQPKLVDALVKALPNLIGYFASQYATSWDQWDRDHPVLGQVVTQTLGPLEYAKSKGLPTPRLAAGCFAPYFFAYPMFGAAIKGNSIQMNDEHLHHSFEITLPEHLARTLAELAATGTPEQLKDQTYVVVTYRPTGAELKELYTSINGKAPTIVPWTKDEEEGAFKDPWGALRAGCMRHWAHGDYDKTPSNAYKGKFDNELPSLEQVAKQFA